MISQEIFTNFGSLELQAASDKTGVTDSKMIKSKAGVRKKAHALLTAETEEERPTLLMRMMKMQTRSATKTIPLLQ